MEQHNNKTERDFRDKLNQREIMPSAHAWDRLDAMLTVAEEKKSKRGYGWLYIAASILGFLTIGAAFLSQTEPVIDQGRKNVVFENQTDKPQDRSNEAITPAASDSGAIASSENPTKINTNQNHNNQSTINNQSQNQSTPIINQNPVEAVNPVPDNQKLVASTNPIINQKTDHPASVKVDELLAAAQSTNQNPKTSVRVNAKNLLSEVDKDVNLTFREKMLRRASEVASTVANRNIE